ncbi:Rv3235 family protein [Streptomyces sp. MST-110588]|uniref:Rv3235 family protein n=1 Tax=Streptomyces sp. MST-110588 TaxID=2833628 RepID=UPI001F5C0C00|nr:Rv3235 family protein [Streptomyces sp. MST-110588]UNO41719.1 hypothetical protein KGS77_21925 [Streptomyces sp. MST-110588]
MAVSRTSTTPTPAPQLRTGPRPVTASRSAGPTRPPRGAPPGRRDSRRPAGRSATVPTSPATPSPAGRPDTRPAVRPAAPSPGARRLARQWQPHQWFAQQLLLTLSGQRPVHALLGHALPAAYDHLVELAPQAPLKPVGRGRPAPAPSVRDCGLCRPRQGVIEAFARIASGEKLRALAFRLELGADSRWRCAALDIGPSVAVWAPRRQEGEPARV